MQSSAGIIVCLVGREAGQAQSHTLGTCERVCGEQRTYNVRGAKVGLEEWGTTSQGTSPQLEGTYRAAEQGTVLPPSSGILQRGTSAHTAPALALQPLPRAQPGTCTPVKVRDLMSCLHCGFGARGFSRMLRVWCRDPKFPVNNNHVKSLPSPTCEISHSLTEVMCFGELGLLS